VYIMYNELYFENRHEVFANAINHPDYVSYTMGHNLAIHIQYATAEDMYKTSLRVAEVLYKEYKRQQEQTEREEAKKEKTKQEQEQLQKDCKKDILAIFELLDAVQRK